MYLVTDGFNCTLHVQVQQIKITGECHHVDMIFCSLVKDLPLVLFVLLFETALVEWDRAVVFGVLVVVTAVLVGA